jgi:hypothetical protein
MRSKYVIIILLISMGFYGLYSQSSLGKDTLPPALKIDLERLKETWHVLDLCAEKIWTGWNNYKDVPFLFEYPNGMKMLVGHPSPPDGFELVPGVEMSEKKVYLDNRDVIPLELIPPLTGGGGPIHFGKEKQVRTVHLNPVPIPEKPTEQVFPGEEQILVNIHELFHCFQEQIYERKYGNLRYNTDANSAIFSEISRPKCYSYGNFQALLLNRFVPGWQKKVQQDKQPLDQILGQYLRLSPDEKNTVQQRLKTRYNFPEIENRHTSLIKKRDEAYEMIQARQGRKYIINFKPTHEYLQPSSRGESYSLGLIHIYPEGIEKIQIQDVILAGKNTPIVNDRLYYIKWIDTEAGPAEKSYELSYSKKEGENIYIDAVFTTKGFVLKAPKIQLKDRPSRVKVTILSKVKMK